MLNDILILDQQWLPNQSDFPPISWHWYRAWPSPIMSGLHGGFAKGLAWQQGTLTLPDTWFRPPLWDLLVLQLLRPDSSNFPCLYSTFHLEYPLVLSRFCFSLNMEAKDQQPSQAERDKYVLHRHQRFWIHMYKCITISRDILIRRLCSAIWKRTKVEGLSESRLTISGVVAREHETSEEFWTRPSYNRHPL